METKNDYKSRGNQSPNEADAVTLLVHGARLSSGEVPSGFGGSAGQSDEWSEDCHRVSADNEYDTL